MTVSTSNEATEPAAVADLGVRIAGADLTKVRWATMDRLKDDLEGMLHNVEEAVDRADGRVCVADARDCARHLRGSLDALDVAGWPESDPRL